ncbi:MAG: ammonia-forming cytochrome c nitrite reductase subunit c552 [Anaerolineae bacterium]
MTTQPQPRRGTQFLALAAAFILGGVLMISIAALLLNIQERQAEARVSPAQIIEIPADTVDPAVWGQNFPRQYNALMKTEDDTISTPYGGSQPINKLERYPVLKRLWAGYAFSVDFNEERGHFYALIDQKETKRQEVVKQPGACANCHAGEAPVLIASMGWEAFNSTPYKELEANLHTGGTCNDCHDPKTMALRITRPAFMNAMAKLGVDLTKATRQEMRTYVCAQCHVEYYFAGENKLLTFPWAKGTTIDDIDAYYTELGFTDWQNKETGARMIKIQHPEYEMYTTSIHYQSGVACADCHMPYVREGALKVSDHWIRSPLTNLNNACQTCHKQDEEKLKERVNLIQNRTAGLLRDTEKALSDAMDAIIAAKTAGATEESLAEAYTLIKRSQMRWDFVFSENSTGFHSPQESARVLAMAIDLARQAQLAAIKATPSTPATSFNLDQQAR